MKRYKVHFSIFNLLSETQPEVSKLQMLFKAISATAITGTWYATSANNALWVGLGGIMIDTLLACLYFEERKTKHHEEEPSKPTDDATKSN